jgi:CheY-like chemotaxis protein
MVVRCLIVDDNDRFLQIARQILGHQGIIVVGVASTCAEALRRLDELRPDVALVDVNLGEENGFELARRITSRESTAEPPVVILISTYDESEFSEMVAISGADAYMSKCSLSGVRIHEILRSRGGH